jgi:hypothetical protein
MPIPIKILLYFARIEALLQAAFMAMIPFLCLASGELVSGDEGAPEKSPEGSFTSKRGSGEWDSLSKVGLPKSSFKAYIPFYYFFMIKV